ncbi:MAG: ribbon-helix-helix protein, CopG family [Acidobacteriaceae bacterium]|jgi:predicted transcriptional regulator
MATREIQPPGLPENLMAEIARIARDQNRSVSEVLAEAVDRYIKEQQWDALKSYGRAQAAERGLTEADVPRLISDFRKESSR